MKTQDWITPGAALLCLTLGVVSCKPYFGTDLLASDQDHKAYTPALAVAGSGFGVAWVEHIYDYGSLRMAEYDIAGARQSRAFPLDLQGGIPALAFSGTAYGLSYRATTAEYRFVVVGADGTAEGGVTLPGDACIGAPLLWNGSGYRIAYRIISSGLYTAAIDAGGSALNGATLVAGTSANPSYQGSMVWTGSTYGLAWVSSATGTDEVWFSLLAADGVPVGSTPLIGGAGVGTSGPFVAWTGSEFGVVWSASAGGTSQVYFERVSSEGVSAGAAVLITAASSGAYEPRIVWGPGEYGVAWGQQSEGGSSIFFRRLDSAGAALEEPVEASTAAAADSPALAWTGEKYVLAWCESPEVSEGYIYTGTATSPIREVHVCFSAVPSP